MSSPGSVARRSDTLCPTCNFVLGDDDRYCANCGRPIQPVLGWEPSKGNTNAFSTRAFRAAKTGITLLQRCGIILHAVGKELFRTIAGWCKGRVDKLFKLRPPFLRQSSSGLPAGGNDKPSTSAATGNDSGSDQPWQPSGVVSFTTTNDAGSSSTEVPPFSTETKTLVVGEDQRLGTEPMDGTPDGFSQQPDSQFQDDQKESSLDGRNRVSEPSHQNSDSHVEEAGSFPSGMLSPLDISPSRQPSSETELSFNNTRWERLMNTGDEALQGSRFQEAELAFQEALREAEGSALPLGKTLSELARAHIELKNFSQAGTLASRAVSVLERVCLPGDTALADALEVLGKIHQAQKNYVEAETLFRRALAIFEKSGLSESIRTAKLLNSLALAHMSLRKYTEAEPLFERSLEILTKVPSPPGATLQTTIYDLKLTYQILKKRNKAESLDRRFFRLMQSPKESATKPS